MNRVLKTLVAGVATVSLAATPAVAMVGVGTAGAAPTVVVSPVGRYTATITFGSTSFASPLRIGTTGTFGFTGGPHGTWTETANVLHMTGTIDKTRYTFVIRQMGRNLGSATKPGTIAVRGAKFGTWYAVRG